MKESDRKLNLCELLEGCEGMGLYSPICGECELAVVTDNYIGVKIESGIRFGFNRGGAYLPDELIPAVEECLLFPDRKRRNWERWSCMRKQERWRAYEGEEYYNIDEKLAVRRQTEFGFVTDDDLYLCGNYFRTSEEAQEYAGKIREMLAGRKS